MQPKQKRTQQSRWFVVGGLFFIAFSFIKYMEPKDYLAGDPRNDPAFWVRELLPVVFLGFVFIVVGLVGLLRSRR